MGPKNQCLAPQPCLHPVHSLLGPAPSATARLRVNAGLSTRVRPGSGHRGAAVQALGSGAAIARSGHRTHAGHRGGTRGRASAEGGHRPRAAGLHPHPGHPTPRALQPPGQLRPERGGAASTPPAPRSAPAGWRPPGAGRGRGRWEPSGRRPHTRSGCSMLRAAALAAAGLGPRWGRRLLSAATQAVPAPIQQPEVFYNQVRPRARRRVLSRGRSPGGKAPASRGLSLPGCPRTSALHRL